jgi:hypothetical protein
VSTSTKQGIPATLTDDRLDALADRFTIDLLLAAFGPFGITTRACDAAAEAVLASSAFAGGPGSLLRETEGQA